MVYLYLRGTTDGVPVFEGVPLVVLVDVVSKARGHTHTKQNEVYSTKLCWYPHLHTCNIQTITLLTFVNHVNLCSSIVGIIKLACK